MASLHLCARGGGARNDEETTLLAASCLGTLSAGVSSLRRKKNKKSLSTYLHQSSPPQFTRVVVFSQEEEQHPAENPHKSYLRTQFTQEKRTRKLCVISGPPSLQHAQFLLSFLYSRPSFKGKKNLVSTEAVERQPPSMHAVGRTRR